MHLLEALVADHTAMTVQQQQQQGADSFMPPACSYPRIWLRPSQVGGSWC